MIGVGNYIGKVNCISASTPLVLDTYTGAVGAYSLRKLRTAYSGSAIRVRRSSDNTEQDIGFISNSLDTSTLLSFVGANDGFVVTWYDQSGSSNNATQSTAVNQPKIVSSGATLTDGGKPAILFDASNDVLPLTNNVFNSLSSYAIFILANFQSATAYEMLFTASNGTGGGTSIIELRRNNLDNAMVWYDSSSGPGSAAIDNLQQLYSVDRNGATAHNYYINNSLDATGALNTNAIGNFQPAIGDRLAGTRRPFGGYIQEVVIYGTAQTSNISGINNNINSFYSLY